MALETWSGQSRSLTSHGRKPTLFMSSARAALRKLNMTMWVTPPFRGACDPGRLPESLSRFNLLMVAEAALCCWAMMPQVMRTRKTTAPMTAGQRVRILAAVVVEEKQCKIGERQR